MQERTIEELGEIIMLQQLLRLSMNRTRCILAREDTIRGIDRARMEKIAASLIAADDHMSSVMRTLRPTKKAPPEGGA